MTEDDARRVLLLRAFENPPDGAAWRDEDRDWATRQALAAVGEGAAPERFVATRAALALPRLVAREPAAARWLERRAWHPGLAVLALLAGVLAGLLADQLGPADRVNLLAPAVWAVVLWNLLVYAALLLPSPKPGLLARTLARRAAALAPRPGLQADWLQASAPLAMRRAAMLMHLAAAGLALGLIAGLYLRGLVLDYRAGWQSTFLDAGTLQLALTLALAPASAVTGIALPPLAPLQLAPGAVATASAAPWIHLYAATLALAVLLPRLALAALAALRARRMSRRLPLALDDDYFEGLHPIMRPQSRRPLALLWCPLAPAAAPVTLLGQAVEPPAGGVQPLFDSDDGDRLVLHGLPQELAAAPAPQPWWRRWIGTDGRAAALRALRAEVDAVLVLQAPDAGAALPDWLPALSRPLLLLADADTAVAPVLPLRALDDGWLADGLLWQALAAALPDDRRRHRLEAAWRRRQQARLDETAALLADSLARLALAREPLPEPGLFGRGGSEAAQAADAARQRLVQQLEAEFAALAGRLAPLWRRGEPLPAGLPAPAQPAVQPRVQARLREGRAALWGGVVSGTLAGLKADLATGGLTMGAGAVAGGVIGALGAAGLARGVNAAQGRERSHLDWGHDELQAVVAAMLKLPLSAHGRASSAAGEAADAARVQAAVQAESEALAAAWRVRDAGLASRLAPVLLRLLQAVLGGPSHYTRAP